MPKEAKSSNVLATLREPNGRLKRGARLRTDAVQQTITVNAEIARRLAGRKLPQAIDLLGKMTNPNLVAEPDRLTLDAIKLLLDIAGVRMASDPRPDPSTTPLDVTGPLDELTKEQLLQVLRAKDQDADDSIECNESDDLPEPDILG